MLWDGIGREILKKDGYWGCGFKIWEEGGGK